MAETVTQQLLRAEVEKLTAEADLLRREANAKDEMANKIKFCFMAGEQSLQPDRIEHIRSYVDTLDSKVVSRFEEFCQHLLLTRTDNVICDAKALINIIGAENGDVGKSQLHQFLKNKSNIRGLMDYLYTKNVAHYWDLQRSVTTLLGIAFPGAMQISESV